MRKFTEIISIALLILCVLSACNLSDLKSRSNSAHCAYYWKSWVSLSDKEKEFLKKHEINRVYLRFFDIRYYDYSAGPVPDAEVGVYASDFPEGTEIVPCVFITLEALEEMKGRELELAKKIYERIDAKCKNGNLTFNEIQLDCDWTEPTRDTFFGLCSEMKSLTEKYGKTLSSTIRLHQLSQQAPDVDKGVLMMYNVGELKNPKETNSILRSDIVKKYLDNAPKYPLPLDVAYPVFSWGVVFNGTDFQRLTNLDTIPDAIPELKRLHDNVYALRSNVSDALELDYLQTIRYEQPSFSETMKTKALVENYLGYKPQNTILYHLDEKQLANYSPDEITKIYE